MTLRPLLPLDHQVQSDVTFLDEDPTLLEIQCRIYVASHILRIGTESRVTCMILFHRYMGRYMTLFLQHYVKDSQPLETGDHDNNSKNDNNDKETTTQMVEREGHHDSLKIQRKHIQEMIFHEPIHRQHLGIAAAACLFVGCRIENEPRRIRDVVNLCHMLDFMGSRPSNMSHPPPSVLAAEKEEEESRNHKKRKLQIVEASLPPTLNGQYWEEKETIVSAEQEVLRMIAFDVQITHPHRILILVLQELFFHVFPSHLDQEQESKQEQILNNPTMNQDESNRSMDNLTNHPFFIFLLQKSWEYMNNTLFHPPSLRQPILLLVCAALQLTLFEEDDDDDKEEENRHERREDDNGGPKTDKGDEKKKENMKAWTRQVWNHTCKPIMMICENDLQVTLQYVQEAKYKLTQYPMLL